jgi:hypothetical protein
MAKRKKKAEELTLDEAVKQAGPAKVRILGRFLPKLPAMIARCDVERLTGGLVSQKTVAYDDCMGLGPRVRLKFRQKVVYPAEYFLEYLESQKVKVIVVQ